MDGELEEKQLKEALKMAEKACDKIHESASKSTKRKIQTGEIKWPKKIKCI